MNDTGRPHSADAALAQVMAYYRREMTMLEGAAWAKLIEDYGDDPVVAFLLSHMETNDFAPKVSEALKMFEPGRRNSTSAYEAVRRQVKGVGPYQAPVFDDPALPRTIVLLGGWLAVNTEFPEASAGFETAAYIKRFEAMYAQACSELLLQRPVDARLRGLHELSKPGGLLESPEQDPPAVTLRVGVGGASAERARI